ncbi:ATPase [Microbacterium testaceum StLB037]|uniref:ATPase n=1 Tax=Microbacterium testaceum (strain StLB037) TaxID=979556 RepID=E8N866_MICTS|nr:MinD/ParA family protein [Microbacterium testaceum]BAJ73086.1 ATPase [Microbacterium testaceum StLB037]
MTPDRIDANPDENAEHGVLDESGNLDTASITILGGHIAQVSVDLPVTSHDDDIDDDVVEDEVPVDEAEIRSFETIGQPFTLDGGNGAPSLTYVPEPQTDPQPTVHDDVHVEHLPTGDIILEPHDDVESDAEPHDELEVHDAEIVGEHEHEHGSEPVHELGDVQELGDEGGDEREREDAVEVSSREELIVAGFGEDRIEPQIVLSTDGFDPEPIPQFVLSTDVFEPEDGDDEQVEDAPEDDERLESERAAAERAHDDHAEDVPAHDERVAEAQDAEPADVEPAEVEPADAEPADAEPAEVEPADTAPADVEVAEAESADEEFAERDVDEPQRAEDDLAEEQPAGHESVGQEFAEDETAAHEPRGHDDVVPESPEPPVAEDAAAEVETEEREQDGADMSDAASHELEPSGGEPGAVDETTPVSELQGAETEATGAEPVDDEPEEDAPAPEAAPADTGAATAPAAATTGAVPTDAAPTDAAPTGAVPTTTGTVPTTTGAVPTATGAVATTTGSIPRTRAERAATGAIGTVPLTRREVHQADEAARVGRAHATERVRTPGPDLTLTSKRSSAIDDARESPDLLTADRLLDPRQVARPEPEGLWQQLVYSMSGHRINLGDGRRARQRKELDRRIAAPLSGGARFVPVLSRKGGVGKTTVTSLLGMALADARDDRVIAVDANPDRGTLADRVGRPNGRTVRDLVRAHDEVDGYHDVSSIVARDATRLDVLASDSDPRVSEAFSDDDYRQVADVAAHYYSIVLTDTGTGIVHSVMEATLERADSLVVVAGLSVDEARLASETLTWLETNGYADRVRSAVVVINSARPGTPLVRESELEAHFRTRVQTVIRMPYDPRIAAGSAISFRDLQPETRLAARQLAAAVVEGLRAPVAAA